MLLHSLNLTTALRPSLSADETLLFVQDAVGLYHGKFKIAEYQNGHAYLTSHRACYVDNESPRSKSVAVNLKDVDRIELYAGFLKSSPKITLHPKAAKQAPIPIRSVQSGPTDRPSYPNTRDGNFSSKSSGPALPNKANNATWICPICSFSNPVPENFDPNLANESTSIPPCLTCGIKPPFVHVVKAAIAGLSARPVNNNHGASTTAPTNNSVENDSIFWNTPGVVQTSICPRCTFDNHPSLTSCEICGASLPSNSAFQVTPSTINAESRTGSPGIASTEVQNRDPNESMKFSFRDGGEKIFHERLNSALVQRKWLLQGAPPTPKHDTSSTGEGLSATPPTPKAVGISGLERRDLELRRNNEVVIGNAFEDLSALMASAKEIIALAEQFSKQTKPNSEDDSADPATLLSQLNLTTTKEMLGPSSSTNTSLYLTELSRQLAEFLTDDSSGVGVLKSAGGIISLVDLWAVFNRARGGVELVSPTDFGEAADLFERLKLPVRLRRFKSGLLVVQGADRTDEKTIRAIMDWLKDLRSVPPKVATAWNWSIWGRGLTALDVAERFGWSVGVATEELEMAEEKGVLCREIAVEGVRFWENWFAVGDEELKAQMN